MKDIRKKTTKISRKGLFKTIRDRLWGKGHQETADEGQERDSKLWRRPWYLPFIVILLLWWMAGGGVGWGGGERGIVLALGFVVYGCLLSNAMVTLVLFVCNCYGCVNVMVNSIKLHLGYCYLRVIIIIFTIFIIIGTMPVAIVIYILCTIIVFITIPWSYHNIIIYSYHTGIIPLYDTMIPCRHAVPYHYHTIIP